MNKNREQIQYFSTKDDGTLIKIIVCAVVFHALVVAALFALHFVDMSKPSKEIPIFEMVQVDEPVKKASPKAIPQEPEPVETRDEPVEKPVEPIEEKTVQELPPDPIPEPVPETVPDPKPAEQPTPEKALAQEAPQKPDETPAPEMKPETQEPVPVPKTAPEPEAKQPEETKPVEKPVEKPEKKVVEKPVKKPVEKKKVESKPKKKPKEDDDFDIGDLDLKKKSFELPSLKAVNPIDMDPLMQVFLERAKQKIMSNFNPPNGLSIPRDSKTTVQFTVERSGRISGVLLKRSSSNSTWDHLSMRAVKISRLPELPPTYSGSSLVLQFNFTPN